MLQIEIQRGKTMKERKNIIRLSGVRKIYGDEAKTEALKGIDLGIAEGDYVALRGRSGSGKSTLLNIIGGMDKLTEGEYLFRDVRVDKLSGKELDEFRRTNISFIFQQFALMMQYTVEENVELPLLFKKLSKKERQAIIDEKLKKMGILRLKNKQVKKLSGGEQQRCAIARALAADSPLILADEPTGALDVTTGEEIMAVLDQLHREGKTILLVTHDAKVAAHAERQLFLKDGRLVDEEESGLMRN